MTKPIKILIADDDAEILELLEFSFTNKGYHVIAAQDGLEALEKAQKHNPEIIILDVMMPGLSGFQLCMQLKKIDHFKHTPVLFLTALTDETNEIRGLNIGADDFIHKPIKLAILHLRVENILKKYKNNTQNLKSILEFDGLKIDKTNHVVLVNNETIKLPKKEFKLLYFLASSPQKVFLRDEILEEIWGKDVIVGDRTIDVHIRKIRKKIQIDCIHTIKGIGYKFEIIPD